MVKLKPSNSKSREANKMTAKPLSQLKLKKGVLIAAIIRKGKQSSLLERICLRWRQVTGDDLIAKYHQNL